MLGLYMVLMTQSGFANDRRGLGHLERACPVRTAIDVISGRWKPSILELLNAGPCRHRDLLDAIPSISTQALSTQLRQLVADGVIMKAGQDIAVYQLSVSGRRLAAVMDGLADWGTDYLAWRQAKVLPQ
jgi:DNA-binding HxlR family transcriptional regulator